MALLAGIAMAIAILFSGRLVSAETPVRADILATIDGAPISVNDYESFAAGYLKRKLYHGGSPDRLKELRLEAAWELIRERLLIREANKRAIPGDTQGVDAQVLAIEEKYAGSSGWESVKAELPNLRRLLLDRSKVEALRLEISRVEEPSESDLKRFYEQNVGLFTEPERIRVKVILLGVDPSSLSDAWSTAKARAEQLQEEIKNGADFAGLARRHSTHESKAAGGDLGLLHRGQLTDTVQQSIDKLLPGQVTPPLRILEGYALFRLDDRLAPEIKSFDAVEGRVRGLYGREFSAKRWNEFVAGVQGGAEIVLNKASLDPPRDGVDGLE